MLVQFEQQSNDLKKEIEKLKLETKFHQEENRQLDRSIEEKLRQLSEYQKENERYKRLEVANQSLTTQNSKLQDRLVASEEKRIELESTVIKMQTRIDLLEQALTDSKRVNQRTLDELYKKRESFFSRLFKKK